MNDHGHPSIARRFENLLTAFVQEEGQRQFQRGVKRGRLDAALDKIHEAAPGGRTDAERLDDYVAWLRWSGDQEHRHLVVCDSDTPGAFKVYRRIGESL